MKRIRRWFRKLFGPVTQSFKRFEVNKFVAARTHRYFNKQIRQVSYDDIRSAALTLEATLAMSEDLPEDDILLGDLTKRELTAFVHYMRQLDSEYRRMHEMIRNHESKNLQKTAPGGEGNGALSSIEAGSDRVTVNLPIAPAVPPGQQRHPQSRH